VSRISPFNSFEAFRYFTANALVIALRVAIDSSIRQDHFEYSGDRRSDAPNADLSS